MGAKADIFAIKTGWLEKVRLFFSIVSNPYQAMQTIVVFGEEYGKLDAELISLKEKLAETMLENTKLREDIYALKNKGL